MGPRLGPGASAGCTGRGGAARPGLRRPRPLGARGCHVVGRRGCGSYIRGFLVSCRPRARRTQGLIEAGGREMLGEVVGTARTLEVFVQSLTSMLVVLV